MAEQCLRVVKPMSDVTRIPVKIQHGGDFGDYTRGLFDEVASYLGTVLSREVDTLVGQPDRAWGLNKDTSALRLIRIVDEGVLVVIEPTNDSYDEEDEDNDTAIHPVDQNEKQDGCPTYPPELPEEKGQHSTESLGRAETHVSIRR